jgi:pyruvate kinase
MERRTRIVATLGPASSRPDVLDALVRAGLDVARINFSHGTAEEHVAGIAAVRGAARRAGRNVAVLADLPGPKLRVRISGHMDLAAGMHISICAKSGCAADMDVTEPECLGEVGAGQRILLDDGRLALVAERLEGGRLIARVTTGGKLLPNKGLNLPDTPLLGLGVNCAAQRRNSDFTHPSWPRSSGRKRSNGRKKSFRRSTA